MLPILSEEMFVNRFVETNLPSKSQIFARTGQHAVSPAGSYTGDESAPTRLSKTQQANNVAKFAEEYDSSQSVKEEISE